MKRVLMIMLLAALVALAIFCRKTDTGDEAAKGQAAKDSIAAKDDAPKIGPVLKAALAEIDEARKRDDKWRLLATLKAAIVKPDIPPEYVKSWTEEITFVRCQLTLMKIERDIFYRDEKGVINELNTLLDWYPADLKPPLAEKNDKKELRRNTTMMRLQKDAYALFDREQWAEAVVRLKILRVKITDDKELNRKVDRCEAKLGTRKIDLVLGAVAKMMANRADVLKRAAEAQKNGEYRKAEEILKPLIGNSSEADEMLRRGKYLQHMAKGNAERQTDDRLTALALYKLARKYAKSPAEIKEVNALIKAVSNDQ
jgi:hypothetical protein